MNKYLTIVWVIVFSLVGSTYAVTLDPAWWNMLTSTGILHAIEARLDRQKIEKNKTRLLSLNLRQYKLKLARAEKIKNIQLQSVYKEVIKSLEIQSGIMPQEVSVVSTGATVLPTLSGSTTESGSTITPPMQTGSTLTSAEELRMSQARTEIKNMYNASGGATQSKSFFLRYFASEYGQNSYNYNYANTLEFQKP